MPSSHRLLPVAGIAALVAACAGGIRSPDAVPTATPIKHLVVIFDENISFDHYFGTYPVAQNPPGEPAFTAAPGTPVVNGLTPQLLQHNPNLINTVNGTAASNPFRIDRSQAATSSQDHSYTPEQMAYDSGAADRFPKYTGQGMIGGPASFMTPAIVMGYFDGNTVTALWNYAQHFAHERQRLRRSVRPVHARRHQSRLGPDQWRHAGAAPPAHGTGSTTGRAA